MTLNVHWHFDGPLDPSMHVVFFENSNQGYFLFATKGQTKKREFATIWDCMVPLYEPLVVYIGILGWCWMKIQGCEQKCIKGGQRVLFPCTLRCLLWAPFVDAECLLWGIQGCDQKRIKGGQLVFLSCTLGCLLWAPFVDSECLLWDIQGATQNELRVVNCGAIRGALNMVGKRGLLPFIFSSWQATMPTPTVPAAKALFHKITEMWIFKNYFLSSQNAGRLWSCGLHLWEWDTPPWRWIAFQDLLMMQLGCVGPAACAHGGKKMSAWCVMCAFVIEAEPCFTKCFVQGCLGVPRRKISWRLGLPGGVHFPRIWTGARQSAYSILTFVMGLSENCKGAVMRLNHCWLRELLPPAHM